MNETSLNVIGRDIIKEITQLVNVMHNNNSITSSKMSFSVGQRGRGRGSGPGRGRGMLNKNKKLKGKPWGGRGRGRGGDQGMEDMAPVIRALKIKYYILPSLYSAFLP